MTHHITSKGQSIAITELNEYHLHGAIKKWRAITIPSEEERAHLEQLEAEQARRGGPPKNAK